MLEPEHFLAPEVGDDFWIDRLSPKKDPKDMGVPKSLFHSVGISILIDEGVVEAVVETPAKSAPLRRHAAEKQQNRFDGRV